MITGDNARTAEAVASQVGMEHVLAATTAVARFVPVAAMIGSIALVTLGLGIAGAMGTPPAWSAALVLRGHRAEVHRKGVT